MRARPASRESSRRGPAPSFRKVSPCRTSWRGWASTVPCLLPVSIPGSSLAFGAIIALNGISLLTHRGPWLPGRLRHRRLAAALRAMRRRPLTKSFYVFRTLCATRHRLRARASCLGRTGRVCARLPGVDGVCFPPDSGLGGLGRDRRVDRRQRHAVLASLGGGRDRGGARRLDVLLDRIHMQGADRAGLAAFEASRPLAARSRLHRKMGRARHFHRPLFRTAARSRSVDRRHAGNALLGVSARECRVGVPVGLGTVGFRGCRIRRHQMVHGRPAMNLPGEVPGRAAVDTTVQALRYGRASWRRRRNESTPNAAMPWRRCSCNPSPIPHTPRRHVQAACVYSTPPRSTASLLTVPGRIPPFSAPIPSPRPRRFPVLIPGAFLSSSPALIGADPRHPDVSAFGASSLPDYGTDHTILIDTPAQPYYTRAYAPLSTGSEREEV